MGTASDFWTSFCDEALAWLYPRKCSLCGLLADSCPCPVCKSNMPGALPDRVLELEPPLAFRACVFAYEGRARQAVTRLKYSRSTGLAEFMSSVVAARLRELGVDGDLLVPIPMHGARQCWRGFNQAELLTRGQHGFEVGKRCLRRVRATRPQAGLSLIERQKNLRGAFEASPDVQGRRVILVDDVVTSGHTARECARVLVKAGAVEVGVVAFAGNLE